MSNHPSPSGTGPAMPPTAIGQLAASIAHEVDQPLAAIALHARAALRCIERAQAAAAGHDGHPEGGQANRQAGEALRAVLQASAHASDILRSMRTLAGQAHAAREHCDLAGAVDDVLAVHEDELARLGVAPRVSIARQARTVHASPVQLRQLLRNLVGNAVDALAAVPAAGRQLRIAAQLDGAGMLVLTVHDTGIGMDAAHARHAFDPMFTTKPGGLGLGLAICRAIVDAHGGRIWAEALPGRGCMAGVALPHPAHEAVADGAGQGAGQGAAARRRHVPVAPASHAVPPALAHDRFATTEDHHG
ncbi:sensor histidine kinase [uncultured Massilia sp.]|uniref:sensor histidine kinase n=1 Tax=uncultured Massilia sp. TaxID=169973 RepID=UPI0025E38397|nr:ATP-binding protein [uncultured Massilia sp.]